METLAEYLQLSSGFFEFRCSLCFGCCPTDHHIRPQPGDVPLSAPSEGHGKQAQDGEDCDCK